MRELVMGHVFFSVTGLFSRDLTTITSFSLLLSYFRPQLQGEQCRGSSCFHAFQNALIEKFCSDDVNVPSKRW